MKIETTWPRYCKVSGQTAYYSEDRESLFVLFGSHIWMRMGLKGGWAQIVSEAVVVQLRGEPLPIGGEIKLTLEA